MDRIRNIVIAGGDAAAPMVAAALANSLRGQAVSITVVGDDRAPQDACSTLPQTASFHGYMGIPPADLLRVTSATFKLGADYVDWPRPEERLVHPYATHGTPLRLVPFHHYYLKRLRSGDTTPIGAYSLGETAAREGRFTLPAQSPDSILSTFSHGFHIDRGAYATLFRTCAERDGVRFVRGAVTDVSLRADSGFIDAVRTDDGGRVEGDLFIDCTGDRARLIGEALGQGRDDWSPYLPSNRRVALTVAGAPDLPPLTSVVRRRFGWSRRIPLRDRSEYTYFFNSDLIDGERVEQLLLRALRREPLAPARHDELSPGVRPKPWHRNCVAIGRAAACIEPLCVSETTLSQSAVLRLSSLFPDRGCDPYLAREFNRRAALEYANTLDFTSLFFTSIPPEDSPFSALCERLEQPESLRYRLDLFRSRGRLTWYDEETFPREQWVSALIGLGHVPDSWDPLAEIPDEARVEEWLAKMRAAVRHAADEMPAHETFIGDLLA
jgi:tryptophan halogenase